MVSGTSSFDRRVKWFTHGPKSDDAFCILNRDGCQWASEVSAVADSIFPNGTQDPEIGVDV